MHVYRIIWINGPIGWLGKKVSLIQTTISPRVSHPLRVYMGGSLPLCFAPMLFHPRWRQWTEKYGILHELKDNMRHNTEWSYRQIRDTKIIFSSKWLLGVCNKLRSIAQRRNEKLTPRYYGPFQTSDRIGEVAYKLQLTSTIKNNAVFHVSKLKKAIPTHSQAQSTDEALSEDWELQPQPLKVWDITTHETWRS